MIIDQIKHWEDYHFGPAWKLAFDFLQSLSADAEEKKYTIQGEDIFAIVMKYETQPAEGNVLETHVKYVDIQVLLSGSESIEACSNNGLTIETPYDEEKDAEFYKRIQPCPTKIDLHPGSFVTFFPHDAHMPSLIYNNKQEQVMKVVVKIKADLLTKKHL